MISASWNPSTNAWVCHVSDPDGDWTAVCIDGVWYNESEFTVIEVRGPDVIERLETAVAELCARGAN